MEFEADPKDTASLKHLAQACERHLREVLRDEEAQADIVKAREGHWASRQFAEFNLWCAKVGVSGEGLKSIDVRLKDVPEICELLSKLLQSLERDLNELQQPTEAPAQIRSADSGVDDDTESDASSLSFQSLSSSEHGEAESAANAAALAWRKRHLALQRHIEDTIDRLHGHALRITRAGAKHRRERVEIYRQKEGPKVLYEGLRELGIRTAKMQFPSASEAFRERMAESFARRRIRFEYLEKHQKKRAVNREVQEEQGLPPEDGDGLAQLQKQELPKRPNIPVRRRLQDQRTIYSATENTKLEMRPQPRRQKRAESVASVALRHPGFPPRPRSSGASFQCPYCRLEFRAREADEGRWSQHVMQDFEPYFCTWEGCTVPFDVPNTFDGLLAHLQDHLEERYHVDMPDGEHKEFNEKEFEEHVARHGKVSNGMLVTMKEASRRKGAFLFESCPFCGGYPDVLEKLDPDTPEAQKELRRHIKQHMQDIALFLPPHREDIVNEDDEFKSSIVTRRSVGHSDLGVPDDFITVCGREGCDCKDKGKHSDEDVSADSPVPEQEEVDFWAERFPKSPLYDPSSVTDEYYFSDERLRPFIARFWSTSETGAASVIAVIDISAKIFELCQTYISAGKEARKDIQRLRDGVTSLQDVLTDMRDLAEDSSLSRRSVFSRLNQHDGPVQQCERDLRRLVAQLELGEGESKMRQFGLRALKWPFSSKDVNKRLQIINDYKATFTLALTSDHFTLTRSIKDDIVWLGDGLADVQIEQRTIVMGEKQQKIRHWLSSPDPSSNHNAACKARQANTGEWFLKSHEFEEWKMTSRSFLWLHGIPGYGKSVLCSTALEEVKSQYKSNPTVAIAYFYFDFNDTEKQRHDKFTHSLIEQLAWQSAKALACLESLFSRCQDGKQQPTQDDLEVALQKVLNEFGETFIILDALDECKERDELLLLLKNLTSWGPGRLHVLSTSRRERDIEEALENLVTSEICLQSALVNIDIDIHISERLQNDLKLKRWPANVREEIKTTLMEGAQGMFLWVVCQLDVLRKCLNIDALRKALNSLPKSLDETYARILLSIDEDYSQHAFRILQWLMYSARPLRIEELVEVIAIDTEQLQFNPENRLPDPRDLLTICSSLVTTAVVTVNDDNGAHNETIELMLAHSSVKEYLIFNRIRIGIAFQYDIQSGGEEEITQSCLIYLLHFQRGILNSENLNTFPLALYAAEHWCRHFRAMKGSDQATKLSMQLFNGDAFKNWIRLFDPDRPLEGTNMKRNITSIASPIYYASLEGLFEPLMLLLERGADVNAQGGKYGNALQAASAQGHETIAVLLLEKGADVNAQGGEYGNALQAASAGGHETIAALLLQKGAIISGVQQEDVLSMDPHNYPKSFADRSLTSEKPSPYGINYKTQPTQLMSRTNSPNNSLTPCPPIAYLSSNSQNTYVNDQLGEKHTPKSLGWQPNTELVEKYKLILQKDNWYLEILKMSDISFNTPERVYLEIPASTQKGSTKCPWPGECMRNGYPFARPADCERHLKHVHGPPEDRDIFPCSYSPCLSGRHQDPFTRKDHYRDHLRDFHYEDIGAAKGEKGARIDKEKRDWARQQKKWLASRNISANHWRCAKCLEKKWVAKNGWFCVGCNQQCEQDRIDARLKLGPKEDSQAAMDVDVDMGMGIGMGIGGSLESQQMQTQLQFQPSLKCHACYAGNGWVDNGYGEWDPCPDCNYHETQIGTQTFR